MESKASSGLRLKDCCLGLMICKFWPCFLLQKLIAMLHILSLAMVGETLWGGDNYHELREGLLKYSLQETSMNGALWEVHTRRGLETRHVNSLRRMQRSTKSAHLRIRRENSFLVYYRKQLNCFNLNFINLKFKKLF